jgi:superfamily II DNA or RNA helicase
MAFKSGAKRANGLDDCALTRGNMAVQALSLEPVARRATLAKLMPPRADRLLARRRLFEQLDALAEAPALWIAAPPGAGKTSLAASWLQARARPTL